MSLKPDYYFESTFDISPDFLKSIDVKLAIVDVDNTLITYGETEANDKVINWLNKYKDSDIKLCISSNNVKKRVSYFANKLEVPFIYSAKKPSKHCVNEAIKMFSIPKENIIMIGDQIFTDVCCARNSKVRCILVKPLPYNENWFFKIKRFFERPIIKRFLKENPDKCHFKEEKADDN